MMDLTLVDRGFKMPEGVGWGFQVAENCREVLIFKEVEEKDFRL